MKANVKVVLLAAVFAALATTAEAVFSYTLDNGQAHSTWVGGDAEKPNNWDAPANWSDNTVPVQDTWRNVHFNLSSATTVDYGSKYAANKDNGSFSIVVDETSAPLTITQSDVPLLWYATGRDGVARTSFVNLSPNHAVFDIAVTMYGYRNYNSGIHPGAEFNRSFSFVAGNPLFVFFAGDSEAASDDVNTTIFRAALTSGKPISIEQDHIVKLDGASASMTASGNSITVAGKLQVLGGAVTCANLSVASGGSLGGSGTINAAVSATSGAILDFSAKTALTFAGTADLTGFTIAASDLDLATTYVVARGTTSLPAVPAALQSDGWMAKVQDGNVVLTNAAEPVLDNVTLTADTDWSENFMAIAAGVTVDLNGYELKVAGVSLGSGAAFVNSGAKANLVIGCNGGDKSFIFGAGLPATIMPVFTGAAVEIPSGFIPAGGIGFKDTVGEQLVYHESCANGLAFLGNAAIAEAGDEWTTQGTSLAVSITGTGNTLHGGDAEAHCWRNLTLTGDGYLTMQRNGQWSIGFSGVTKDFSGTLHLKQGNISWVSDYFGIGTGDLSFANGTIVLEPSLPNNEYTVFFSNNKFERHIGDLQTSGDYAAKARFKDKNNATVSVGFLNNDSAFDGNLLRDGGAVPNFVKVGTGTWTLSGTIANEGTFSVNGGSANFAGATFDSISGLAVGSDGRITGTSTIPATLPVTLGDGAAVSGSLTFEAAPTTAGTAKLVPEFSGAIASLLTFDYESPSLAAFVVEAETIPVVAAGTEFVIAEGPAGSTIVAPAIGASATDAGWEVRAEGNQVILTSTSLPPLYVSGVFSLTDDYDYSTGTINVDDGAVIDLCGHTLKVGAITFAGSACFTNSAASTANLEAGYEGTDKSWLWSNADLTLASAVRAVIVGEAVEIPDSFVPAGGIGFKDTVGEQFLSPASCANGLAFLGGAALKEPSGTWAFITPTFPVLVEGNGNTFSFDNTTAAWEQSTAFKMTPFSGSGELTFTAFSGSRGRIAIGNKDVNNTAFSGTIRISSHPVSIWDDSNSSDRGFRNGTVVLANDADADMQCLMDSGNWSSPIYCNIGSLVAEGDHANRVSLAPVRQAGGVHLTVGRDGIGGGTFAGSFVNVNGNDVANYDIEKLGTGTWTLTGTVANGGAFNVASGEVDFENGVDNVTTLTVANGAKALLKKTVSAGALSLASGSTLVLAADDPDNIPYYEGSLSLSGITVEVRMGAFTGGSSRDLLRVNGTISGFDVANVNVVPGEAFMFDNPKKYTFEVVDAGEGCQVLKYVPKRGLAVIVF